MTTSELERLGANNVLHTIERDTGVGTGRTRASLLKAWLRHLARIGHDVQRVLLGDREAGRHDRSAHWGWRGGGGGAHHL